jgi:hypothetical protein
VILPTVTAYATGLLDHLFRGELKIDGGAVVVGVTALGKGKPTILSEDAEGRRKVAKTVTIEGGQPGDQIGQVESGGEGKFAAVFEGVDGDGEQLVAVGVSP